MSANKSVYNKGARRPTARQTEVAETVKESGRNFHEAARRLGITPKSVASSIEAFERNGGDMEAPPKSMLG